MCSAIFLRMTDIGTDLPARLRRPAPGRRSATRSDETARPAAAALRRARSAALAARGAPPTKARMSSLVTRPAMPVPWICEMSTLCSFAIFRTSGDERCRRRVLDRLIAGVRLDGAAAAPDGGRRGGSRSPDRQGRSAGRCRWRLPSACGRSDSAVGGAERLRRRLATGRPGGGARQAAAPGVRLGAGGADHRDDAVDRNRLAFLGADLGDARRRPATESPRPPCRSRSRRAARRARPGRRPS